MCLASINVHTSVLHSHIPELGFANLGANFNFLLDPWLILINIKSETNINFGFLIVLNALGIPQLPRGSNKYN